MLEKIGAVCLAAVLLLTGCTLRPRETAARSRASTARRWNPLSCSSPTR